MTWSLYQGEKFLEPLCFSSGKTQQDVVKEVLEAVEEGNKVIFIHGICGTGKCLDKDSLIFCKPSHEKYFGYYKIKDLNGKEGKIISVDSKGKLIESTFKNVRKTGKKKLHKLKTRTGREIIASQNHPFLTITKNGVEWKPLEKLDSSSYICLPNRIEVNDKIKYEENKIKILAHLIAEGKLGDKVGSPKFYQCANQNPEIRADYINSLKNLFPDGEIKERDKEVSIKFGLMDTRFGTTNKLRLFIREHGLDGKKSGDKFVPKIIFNLDDKMVALFLKILFSCDGSIYKRNSGQIVVEYSSISKRLIMDVSILLGRFGVHHTITSKRFRDNPEYSWRIYISNQEQIRKYIANIGFIGRKQKLALELFSETKDHKFTNIDKVPRVIREYLKSKGYNYTELDRFLNYEEIEKLRGNIGFKKIRKDKSVKTPFVFNQQKIDFLREHIKKINEYIRDDNLSFICKEEIIWDKIKLIEHIGNGETYDLEVPKHHNFIANGMIVHNSAIALNIAKKLGKASVVVPIKNLQAQYERDYGSAKHILDKNGKKLKISVITGRANHKCKFIERGGEIPKIKREINSKLHDIFAGKREEGIKNDVSANRKDLPCKIEIKDKNSGKIKEYLKQNKDVNYKNFQSVKDVKRMSVAGACPYWSPVIPSKYELGGKSFTNAIQKKYVGLDGTEFVFYHRKPGCKFYEQFNYYVDSDVIVFNSLKYKLESLLNRKPRTEVEIIDECDEFLDSFSNQRTINIERLQNSLVNVFSDKENVGKIIEEISSTLKQIKGNKRVKDAVGSEEIIPLRETGLYDLLKIFLYKSEFLDEVDEESYLFSVEETALIFGDFFDESYVTFSKKDDNLIANIVTTNLAKRFKEMVDKNKLIVLMSGTLHSDSVLKNVFGLEDFKIIEAETEQQGRIEVKKTGLEMDCRYSKLGKDKRDKYLKALSKCVEVAPKPVLVHINAFIDLPTEQELETFDIDNLISREKLGDLQSEDKTGKLIEKFKKGQVDVLFSTRASRGIDFPGEECNSIIFTKYPNPNVQEAFWKILSKTKPQHYWDFYKDKARRELWQKIYRGLRFKEDHVYVLSPDSRVLEAFESV
ncbi:MAG: hypothetical protein KJ721_03410 [Nanoarchaeota archaeon]|nr:hypothetical protein [Nanoarchaeota archaeon]